MAELWKVPNVADPLLQKPSPLEEVAEGGLREFIGSRWFQRRRDRNGSSLGSS